MNLKRILIGLLSVILVSGFIANFSTTIDLENTLAVYLIGLLFAIIYIFSKTLKIFLSRRSIQELAKLFRLVLVSYLLNRQFIKAINIFEEHSSVELVNIFYFNILSTLDYSI